MGLIWRKRIPIVRGRRVSAGLNASLTGVRPSARVGRVSVSTRGISIRLAKGLSFRWPR